MIFKSYDQDQLYLLPPLLREWLPRNHLAHFISDVVDEISLDAIMKAYSSDDRGQPPYQPAMILKIFLYAYCVGIPSSWKIEKRTHEDVAFRFLAAGHHPDHDTIAIFRSTHLEAMKDLFLQVLVLCREASLVRADYISLDGTKLKSKAPKHKAMSYAKMTDGEKDLEKKVKRSSRHVVILIAGGGN